MSEVYPYQFPPPLLEFARKHRDAIRFLRAEAGFRFDEFRLTWAPAFHHSVMCGILGEVICQLLALPEEVTMQIVRALLLHDCEKRAEKDELWGHITPQSIQQLATPLGYHEDLIGYTKQGCSQQMLTPDFPLDGAIVLYVDKIMLHGSIVSILDRIEGTKARYLYQNIDWEMEERVGSYLEHRLEALLQERRIDLQSKPLHVFLRKELINRQIYQQKDFLPK